MSQHAHQIDLRTIATPLERAVFLPMGFLQAELIEELRSADFDQAPIRDVRGEWVGVLGRTEAAQLVESHTPLDSSAPIERKVLPTECSIEELLDTLAKSRGVLVDDAGRPGWLVTVSDLNRHRLRTVLYGTVAELEALSARLIDIVYDEAPWDWLVTLGEDAQARLVGYWEVSKRRGVDIGPLAGTTLTELLAVISKSTRVREMLGYRSATEFLKDAGRLPDYRNRVMHPVRPLVLSHEDVLQLKLTLERIDSLIKRSRVALAEASRDSRVAWL